MDQKTKQCVKMLRDLVSDVQGAPYPGEDLKPELYRIWYEHAQKAAINCYEFLDDNFPDERRNVDETIRKIFR